MGLGVVVSSVGVRKMGARTFPGRWLSGNVLFVLQKYASEESLRTTIADREKDGQRSQQKETRSERCWEKERQSRDEAGVRSGAEGEA